jgi:bifunctional non-homologous end joining protein LigD
VIDGEAVILGVDGDSDFNALHSGKHNNEVQLCAFDVLAMDGDDLRSLPLSMRKANLVRLLARRPDGIFLSDFEHGEIGPDLFVAACQMGLEGLVSKHRDRPYQAVRSEHWVKVKNRKHPAMHRTSAWGICLLLQSCDLKSVVLRSRTEFQKFVPFVGTDGQLSAYWKC